MKGYNPLTFKRIKMAIQEYMNVYKTYIKSKLLPETTKYETEVRFTEFSQERGVSLRTFNRLAETFGTPNNAVINQKDYISSGIRKTEIGQTVKYMSKKSIWDRDSGPP